MHELNITKQLIAMIEDECQKRGIRPNIARVEIGKMTTYKKESIEYYFDILRNDTPVLKSCLLDVKEIDAVIECSDCRLKRKLDDPFVLICPVCDSTNVELISGEDIRIKEVQTDV